MRRNHPFFDLIKVQKPKRSLFDMSHRRVFSFNMGELIPFMVEPTLPSEIWRIDTSLAARFQSLIAPVMHQFDITLHFFHCANKNVWTNWEDFITMGEDGTSTPTFPQLTFQNSNKAYCYPGKLPDYLGLPVSDSGTGVTQNLIVSGIPFRHYQHIWNEYYRDQNTTSAIVFTTGNTCNDNVDALLRNVTYERDYFCSALPWVQRGAAVTIPVAGQITFVPEYQDPSLVQDSPGGTPLTSRSPLSTDGSGDLYAVSETAVLENLTASKNYAINSVTATINELRSSYALQRWFEANARGGSRYIENILNHFGFLPKDIGAKFDRPEYIGGAKMPLRISEVLSTAESTNYEVGDMFGHGLGYGSSGTVNYRVQEHGYIMGVMFVMPRTAYYQGVPKHFLYEENADFPWPEYANLGEQAIKQQEVYHDWTGTDKDDDFGYVPRYSEAKYRNDSIHGEFTDNLDHWQYARKFASAPALNQTFMEFDNDDRIFTVTSPDYDKIYCELKNSAFALKPLPKFGTPFP